MPVDMRVPGVAAEAEDVEPLGRDRSSDCGANPAHNALKAEVLVLGEVIDYRDPVVERRDKAVAQERRVQVEEPDREIVSVDDMRGCVGCSRYHLADKAGAFSCPPGIGLHFGAPDLAPNMLGHACIIACPPR